MRIFLALLCCLFARANSIIAQQIQPDTRPQGHTGLLLSQDSVVMNGHTTYCIVVNEVLPNSPAAATNIQKGDKLISINGMKTGMEQVDIEKVNQMMGGLANTTMAIEIERSEAQKRSKRMTYILERKPEVVLPKARVYGIGVTLSLDSVMLDGQLTYTAMVTGIYPNSPADKAGINPGDFIYMVESSRIDGKSLDVINQVVDRLLIYEPKEVDVSFMRPEGGTFALKKYHMSRIDLSYYTRNHILPIRVLVKATPVVTTPLNEDALQNQHDKDKDGVDDADDACPEVPGKYSINPFENGCPE